MPPQSSDFAGADPTESFVYRGDREYLSSATQVHGFCRSYLVISTLRWLLLLTLCMALGVPVYHKVDVYYRGQIDVCGACLFKARADPAHFYEWSICAANNVTEFRVCMRCEIFNFILKFITRGHVFIQRVRSSDTFCNHSFDSQAATDYNLLRELSNNVNFAPSSDLAQIIPVSAFLYGMAMLGFISYGLYLCIWTKKSNDPETASAEYFRQATVINIVFVRARARLAS
jgi:hypothetical protein